MKKCIIDANVVLLAPVKRIPSDQLKVAQKCLRFIREFMSDKDSRLVLDAEWRILKEYRNAYADGNERNIAQEFYTWVCQNISKGAVDMVQLKEIRQNEFEKYPDSDKLKSFDPSDRKYIALAYNHAELPLIIEASDSKWWGIQDELRRYGIEVNFIDEDYIKMKYMQKIGI